MGSKTRTMLKLALGLVFLASLAQVEAYYYMPHVGYSVYGYHWPYLNTRYTHFYGKREAEAEPEADAEAYYRGFGSDQTAYLLGHIPVIFLMDQAQTDERMDTSYPSEYSHQSPSQPEASLIEPKKVSYFNNGVRQLILLESTPDRSYMNNEESQYAVNQLNFGFENPSSGYKNPASGYQNPSNGYQTQSGRFEYSFNQQEKFPKLPEGDFYRNDYSGNSGFINQNQQQLHGGNFARGQVSYEDQSYYGAADASRYSSGNIYPNQFPSQQAPNNPNQNKAYNSVGFNPTETKVPSYESSDKKLGISSVVDLRGNEENSRPTAYNRPAQRQNSKANMPRGFSDQDSRPFKRPVQRKDFQSNTPRGNSAKESKPKDQKTSSS